MAAATATTGGAKVAASTNVIFAMYGLLLVSEVF